MNAKDELLKLLDKHGKTLKAAAIEFDEQAQICLYEGYTSEEYSAFLNEMNVAYDNGYGIQELFGVLWFTDGTHARRGTYDGAEWWVVLDMPPIPKRGERLEEEPLRRYSIGG